MLKWVGAEAYDDKGDIKVYPDGTEVHCRTKVSYKGGSGTKANPSNLLRKLVQISPIC